ncbi:OmpA/MotB family protein [Dolichospermum circinale]|uniref:OmpA/MotB family protein n=1 Tax=Dolichospermum circinale TaxID=109265 RepID=UPI00232FC0D2|nr:flagellar motor protein [Dolichospermum circinale]MDB9454584.1 flagellar motor protein [Dolichospermum circinale CS-541/06]MDB9462266.1 flagellar motor protein [Dolichospermum circinale CS-541/04]MDB9547365.1 flagellar motor protein [Dolichospermum circinale CS-1031]
MARRSRYTQYNEDLNVWPAFTDLMSNAFMILVLFLFLTIIISQISEKKATDAPPIIVIKDEGAYRFASGSAEISQEMSNYILQKIVPEIEARTKQYGINVVEIIGHTDGQANGQVTSNLDVNLENVVSGNIQVGNLRAGSNADLGLMRALSVVKALRDIQTKENRLSGLSFRAYSAAQLILPNGQFAAIARQDDVTRRRIEIRFTRLGEVQEVR